MAFFFQDFGKVGIPSLLPIAAKRSISSKNYKTPNFIQKTTKRSISSKNYKTLKSSLLVAREEPM